MKKKILRAIPLLLVAFLITWMPVFAHDEEPKEYKFKVINRSAEAFVLKIKGPENYTFEIPAESSSKKKVLEGDYDYFYEVCDGDFGGDVLIVDNSVVFEIYDCSIQPVPTKFVVESHFGETIRIDMTGPLQVKSLSEDFALSVTLGNNRFNIDSGIYVFSYDACDTTFTEQIRIAKSGVTKLRLTSCESLARRELRAEFGPLDPVKFRVANRFAVGIDITLIGPQTYYISSQPGINRYEVVAGTYNYIFAAFGVRYEGIIEISANGDTVLTIPFSVSSTEKI